jgi:hypothetical protein
MSQDSYICPTCWNTVTVERAGADTVYSAAGSTITYHKEEKSRSIVDDLLGRAFRKAKLKIEVDPPICPICNPSAIGGLF